MKQNEQNKTETEHHLNTIRSLDVHDCCVSFGSNASLGSEGS
jgi:hypothetical protein